MVGARVAGRLRSEGGPGPGGCGASSPGGLYLDEPRGLGAVERWRVGSEGPRCLGSKEQSDHESGADRGFRGFFAGKQAGCRRGQGEGAVP